MAEWEQSRAVLIPHSWLLRHLRGIALTSFVASLATLPFAMFYFGRATHYPLMGNLLAMPVMGLLVMPAAALSVLAMPFGLEHWPLELIGEGISLMLALGGLWLLIWRRRVRLWGLLPMLAGIIVALSVSRPDVLIASDARTVAVRGEDVRLDFPVTPKDRYAAQRWLLRNGDSRSWQQAVGGGAVSCDGLGCVLRRKGLLIALAGRAEAMDEDCARADIVIAATPLFSCNGPKLALGSEEIASGGGYTLTLAPLDAVSVNQVRGDRPWVHSQ